MNEETLTLISAGAGIVAAFAALFAAANAFRSAGAAKQTLEHARELERRSMVRDVAAAAQNVVAETLRVDELANALKRAHRDLAIFSGGHG